MTINFSHGKQPPRNSGEQNRNQMRTYLATVESVARHGRTSSDPQETVATIECFAYPSAVLRRLADSAQRCHQ